MQASKCTLIERVVWQILRTTGSVVSGIHFVKIHGCISLKIMAAGTRNFWLLLIQHCCYFNSNIIQRCASCACYGIFDLQCEYTGQRGLLHAKIALCALA